MIRLLITETPKDINGLLWALAVGAAGVIGFLYLRLERCKTECDKDKEQIRKDAQERYDKLNIDFSNYKDKTVEEKIESSEKFLTVIVNFQQELKDLPEKVVSKSLGNCRANMQKYIDDLKNERGTG